MSAQVTVSIVSHRQNRLANHLTADLARHCGSPIRLILTQNAPDPIPFSGSGPDLSPEIILNERPKGFAANHNAAFLRCATPYFAVLNPDLRISADPFPRLLRALEAPRAGVVGPLVRNPLGTVDDSARRYPTARLLVRKFFARPSGPDYPTDRGALDVEWLAGMFMLFPSQCYRAVGGFDESYFLYYEDVDLCQRLNAAGWRVIYEPRAEVIHDARRASRRNPRLAWHHLRSALRFLARR